MDLDLLSLLPLWYVTFLLSTTCHEAAHALAAKLGGDPTAFHAGQVSLNPLPHMRREPMGMLFFPFLTYLFGGFMMGWASAPYDPAWQRRHPRRAAWMSLAGPAANFALVLLAAGIIHGGLALGWFRLPMGVSFTHIVDATASPAAEGAAQFVSILFSLNLLLGTFNLLPAPPLDGFSALGIVLPARASIWLEEFAQRMRPLMLIGLLVAWQVFGKVYTPIFLASVMLLYPQAAYVR